MNDVKRKIFALSMILRDCPNLIRHSNQVEVCKRDKKRCTGCRLRRLYPKHPEFTMSAIGSPICQTSLCKRILPVARTLQPEIPNSMGFQKHISYSRVETRSKSWLSLVPLSSSQSIDYVFVKHQSRFQISHVRFRCPSTRLLVRKIMSPTQ